MELYPQSRGAGSGSGSGSRLLSLGNRKTAECRAGARSGVGKRKFRYEIKSKEGEARGNLVGVSIDPQ